MAKKAPAGETQKQDGQKHAIHAIQERDAVPIEATFDRQRVIALSSQEAQTVYDQSRFGELKENKFIYDNGLANENAIKFTHFVSPNRWTSMFGQYYFMTKALIWRLKEESAYYNTEVNICLFYVVQLICAYTERSRACRG